MATGEEPRVSRSHQSTFLPGGLIATTDLGFDLVRLWRRGRMPARCGSHRRSCCRRAPAHGMRCGIRAGTSTS
ncbi:hypothetical protein [Microbacterium sp. NIBRBAC000506063]|uniref:hypothetical protein n=1 Tax=Microbacterium sp. NIBRBAC000506063 TaxID=2734618 RepID=UPI001CB70CBB|nr:hypothetical protein [Microbacterium sp. NIBRBAC000506063]